MFSTQMTKAWYIVFYVFLFCLILCVVSCLVVSLLVGCCFDVFLCMLFWGVCFSLCVFCWFCFFSFFSSFFSFFFLLFFSFLWGRGGIVITDDRYKVYIRFQSCTLPVQLLNTKPNLSVPLLGKERVYPCARYWDLTLT